jgi:Leucine-rich repeat (LRR) protein
MKLTQLRYLYLSCNRISDFGAAKLCRSRTLRYLPLCLALINSGNTESTEFYKEVAYKRIYIRELKCMI